ncbi:MAG: hypothetical protein M1586_00585 [Patescibacteria group bacterium]|nr:hypothetical protein [Patescibacteria group bacterium]MCL5261783.1 hypothetical protein [Patescibacteria group bacterium]
MKTIEFDEERAKTIFGLLTDFWHMARPLIKLPQDRLPLLKDASPEELANYLFFLAIFQRGGVISDTPSDAVHRIYATRPDLFDPFRVARMTKDEILRAIEVETVLGYKIEEFAQAWIKNARFLVDRFDGNALNLVDAPDFAEAYGRVQKKLYGIRMKIFSLFVIWLQERGLVRRFAVVPPPIDFHALRLLISTGVVKTENLEEPIPAKILDTKTAKEYPQLALALVGRTNINVNEWVTDSVALGCMERIEKFGYTHLDINPGMWTFSRNFCSKARQNTLSRRKSRLLDPAVLWAEPGLWGKTQDACGVCPVSKYCRRVFPSGPYYRFGRLVPIERLDRFAADRLIAYPEEPEKVRLKLIVKFLTRDGNGHAVAPPQRTAVEQISLFVDP